MVLLSTVDHYNRVAKDTRKRVVGVLLGSKYKGTVDVTNRWDARHSRLGGKDCLRVSLACGDGGSGGERVGRVYPCRAWL